MRKRKLVMASSVLLILRSSEIEETLQTAKKDMLYYWDTMMSLVFLSDTSGKEKHFDIAGTVGQFLRTGNSTVGWHPTGKHSIPHFCQLLQSVFVWSRTARE